MYPYEKYIGKISKTKSVDFGKKIMKLNWNISSFMLDSYIYQNDAGDLFYVNGVLQHPSVEYGNVPNNDRFHLVLAIPIKSKKLLVEYLNGDIEFSKIFNKSSSYSYVLKLSAPTYKRIWSDKEVEQATMCPVEKEKEVTRKVQLQLHEFKFIECKRCLTKTLPYICNPKTWFWKYELGKKFSFIFISDEEKKEIKQFIKDNKIKK